MNKAHFVEKLATGSIHEIFLITGFDFTGQKCWYLMKVPRNHAMQFSSLIGRGEVTALSSHGAILASGYGDAPPPSSHKAFLTPT